MKNTRLWGSAIFPCASIFLLIFLGACSSDSPVCGDGVLNGDEQCDGYDYGGQNCESLNFNGGHLYCNADCSIDDRSCHNCEEDPCRGVDCSGHGRCVNYDDNCIPLCECDEGYISAAEGQCVEEGSCKRGGETCESDGACCMGRCYEGYYGEERYCIDSPCQEDSDCVNHGDDGREMFCNRAEFLTTDMLYHCIKLPAGISPGDRSGTCGDSCTDTMSSACADGYFCLNRGAEDPTAFCSLDCETDADCTGCVDPENHFADPYCLEYIDGSKFCYFDFLPCNASSDCPTGLECTVTEADEGGYTGVCVLMGGKTSGEECVEFTSDDWSYQAWEDRCANAQCRDNHCADYCSTDLDCPEDTMCLMYFGPSHPDIKLCIWTPGTHSACDFDGDCPTGEMCRFYTMSDGSSQRICIEQYCDPAENDCLGAGEICDPENDSCYNELCAVFTYTDHSHCSTACSLNEHCPEAMVCFEAGIPDNPDAGLCGPVYGSGLACQTRDDCAEGETCHYYGSIEGVLGLCESYPEDAGDLGEVCNAAEECIDPFCFDMEIGSLCSQYCISDEDCPLPYHCYGLEDGDGEIYAGYCWAFDGSGETCDGLSDCLEGESCFPALGIDGIVSFCTENTETGAEFGEACTDHVDCKSRFCIFGRCDSLCSADEDCPLGDYCHGFSFTGYEDQRMGACESLVEGSATACVSNGDCPSGESCHLYFKVDVAEGMCATADTEGGDQGDTCESNVECDSGLCLTFGCGDLCMTDEHCPAGNLCMAFTDAFLGVMSSCIPWDGSGDACLTDAACIAEEACAYVVRESDDHKLLDFACTTEIAAGGTIGQSCGVATDCYNRMCLYFEFGPLCSEACQSDTDCPADWYCVQEMGWFAPPPTGFCRPKDGSFTPCADDGECTETDEICLATMPYGEEPGSFCSQGIADGALNGEACESNYDCMSRLCFEGLCTTPCDDDGDCSPFGMVCGTAELNDWASLSACVAQ